MTTHGDLEYLALRLERLAREDQEMSMNVEVPLEIRHHREARSEGLRWAAREIREFQITPEYVGPPHLRDGG